MSRPRQLGLAILAGACLLVLGALGWLQAALADGEVSARGYALALLLVLASVLPVMAGGIWLVAQGSIDLAAYRLAAQARRLHRLVQADAAPRLPEVLIALDTDRAGLRAVAALAAAEGLLGGYVDWRAGRLHAGRLEPGQQDCPVCGGRIEIAGRGAEACPYCQTLLIVGTGPTGGAGIRGIAPPD